MNLKTRLANFSVFKRLRSAWQRGVRQPLAGVALAAVAGIAVAEGWRGWFLPRFGDGSTASGVAVSLFVMLIALWWHCHRRGRLTHATALFWGVVATAYAALHFLGSDPVAAGVLARRLAIPVTAAAAVDDPENASAHILHVIGTVRDLPRRTPASNGGANWRFTAVLETAGIDGDHPQPCHAPVAVEWRDGPRAVDIGDRIELTALAENVAPPRNPGEFDEKTFLRRQGVLSGLRLSGLADGHLLNTRPTPGSWLTLPRFYILRAARRCHDWMANRLGDDLHDDPEASAVISTALLGLRDRPGLGPLEPAFQRTGTLHYFAIDGLKLGLVSLLLLRLLTFLRVPRPWPGVLVLPLLFGYALATGLGSASARAVLVAAAFLGGEALDRPVRPLNSLGGAAVVLLLFDTQQLFELGFQLTFLVVLTLLTCARPLQRWLERFGAPDPFLPVKLFSRTRKAWEWLRKKTCSLTAISLAAWLGSLPLMLVDFHFVSVLSPLANVVVFPFAFAVLALGVLSLAGSAVWHVSVWFNNANWLMAKTLLFLVRAFDAVPGGSFGVAAPEHWHLQPPAAELVVLDLGRARAACLHAGPATWLIDAARPFEYTRGVQPCLRARGVQRLDGLLLTQGDADHLAAAQLALAEFFPARVVDPALMTGSSTFRDFRKSLTEQSRPEISCRRGDSVSFTPGIEAHVLYPPNDLPGRVRAAADRALVLQIRAAGWRVLLLTEGDSAAGAWLLAHEPPVGLVSEVLVTAGPTIPADLLAAVRPRLVVLRPPVAREPKSGQARVNVPEGILPAAATFRQIESGAVTLRLYPDRIEAQGFVDGRKVVLQR